MTKSLLFSPIQISGLTLKNRVFISPMATYMGVDGKLTDWHLGHIGRLALGGAGMVMVEATAVTYDGQVSNGDSGLWSAEHVPGHKRVADLMRQMGVVPAIQLAHAGRKGAIQRPWHGNGPLQPVDLARGDKTWVPVGPTAEPLDEGWQTPKALSVSDLKQLRQQWADAAERALEAGYEVLEIHNAHGYLIHQFLSPLSNTRDDAYGGDIEGRMRFPLEVAEAIRAVWPADKPLFLRVSAVDGLDGGWSINDTVVYAKALKKRGIDLIDCSSGGLRGSATVARVKRTYGYQVPFAEQVRREAGIKTSAVGLILDPHHAEEILQQGHADLIAIGREALVNPSWPQMAEIALGRPTMDALEDYPLQYSWWLKHRERALEEIRAEGA